jgi:hypothetical protein
MFSAAGNYTLRENVGCDGRKLVLCLSNVMVIVRQTQLDDLYGSSRQRPPLTRYYS